MIFRRRARLGFWARLRGALAPRKSWRRGFEYIGRRVQRLPDTPHRIALGAACGVLASFTPLFTLHFVLAVALAWVARGNLIAAALGTAFGNPLTFPFIAGVSLRLGAALTGGGRKVEGFTPAMAFTDFGLFMDKVFLPYLVGGIAPGLLCAALSYAALRPVVAAYQNRRRLRLAGAAGARLAAHLRGRAPKTNPVPGPGA
jgi:uncharacterized protein (DUF2062 family)